MLFFRTKLSCQSPQSPETGVDLTHVRLSVLFLFCSFSTRLCQESCQVHTFPQARATSR